MRCPIVVTVLVRRAVGVVAMSVVTSVVMVAVVFMVVLVVLQVGPPAVGYAVSRYIKIYLITSYPAWGLPHALAENRRPARSRSPFFTCIHFLLYD